jgi:hypothetical protein
MRLSVSSLASFVLGLSAVACGGSSTTSGGGSATAFVGDWTCTASFAGSNSAQMIAVVMNPDGSITATGSGDAGLDCALTYTVKGGTATVESGQSCSAGNTTVDVTGGSTTVGGPPPQLSGTLTVTYSGFPVTETYGCTKS